MEKISIFISYSHDSQHHRERVLSLAQGLRTAGLATEIDQYVVGSPLEGWPRWMMNQFDAANIILVVCTETYYRRFRGHEGAGVGRGVDWEGALITQEIYEGRRNNVKFIPVVFAAEDAAFVPDPLRKFTWYDLSSENARDQLYRVITGQSEVERAPLGEPQSFPQRDVMAMRFGTADTQVSAGVERLRLRVADTPGSKISKSWRDQLLIELRKELSKPELAALIHELAINLGFPAIESGQLPYRLAEVLAASEGERSYDNLAHLLNAAYQVDKDRTLPLHNVFAYLLQTCVRKCRDESDEGFSKISVRRRQSAELIGAAKASVPHLPNYGESDREYRNGKRNAKFENIGHFLPETGTWDEASICNAIAAELLVSHLGYSSSEVPDAPLNALRARLKPYRIGPRDRVPIHGLFVSGEDRHHKATIPQIAKRLHEELEGLLWIYEYGDSTARSEWLYASEDDIEGLVRTYSDERRLETSAQPSIPSNQEMAMTDKNITLGNIGDGAVVNFNLGNQTASAVGRNNTVIAEAQKKELGACLERLLETANTAPDLTKQDYAVITRATQQIKDETGKAEGAHGTVLKQAAEVLSGFKHVATMAESIQKITELLLPFLG